MCAVNALMAPAPEGEKPQGTDMMEKYELAQHITKNKKECEISSTQAAMLLEKISQTYGVLVYGQMAKALD